LTDLASVLANTLHQLLISSGFLNLFGRIALALNTLQKGYQ
jgi:hypothetical protein